MYTKDIINTGCMNTQVLLRVVCAWGALVLSAPALGCERVALLEPAAGSTVSEPRPWLVWPPGAPVRVQLALVQPEAGLLHTEDLQVAGDRWRLPEAAAMRLASVKLIVSRGCPDLDAAALQAQGPAFFIDSSARCRLEPASVQRVGDRVRWAAVAKAQSYRVRWLYDPGGPAGQAWRSTPAQAVVQPEWRLPETRPPGSAALGIEAVCDGVAGAPVVHPLD